MSSAKDRSEKTSHGAHLGIMLIGYLVMLLGLRYLGTSTSGSSSLGWIMVAACPLMHVYMMLSMRGRDDSEEDDTCH